MNYSLLIFMVCMLVIIGGISSVHANISYDDCRAGFCENREVILT